MKKNFSRVFPTIVICICLILLFATSFPGQTPHKNEKPRLALAAARVADENLNRPRLIGKAQAYEVAANNVKTDESSPEENKNESSVKTSAAISMLERQTFDFLNRNRIENNLPPLVWNDRLAKIARRHSESMAADKFFSHRGKDGTLVDARAEAAGVINWQGIGENIAFNQGIERPVEFACERWMLSTSHRGNVLNKSWRETGVGVSVTPDGKYYFTQVFILR